MSKYAMITPCTKAYLPGLNANLNALDLYENDIDVFVIDGGDLPKDYMEEAKKAFRFKVTFIPLQDLASRLQNLKGIAHHLLTASYLLSVDLAKDYDVVSLIGGDMVIVNNIMKWFKIAETTGYIVTAQNSFSLASLADINENQVHINGLLSCMPVADCPGIMSTRLHLDVIKKTLEFTNKFGDNMKCFNSVLHQFKKADQVLALPGNLWTCGVYYTFASQQGKDLKGRPTYFANRERMYAIHRRWWRGAVRNYAYRGQKEGSAVYKDAYNNTQMWEGIYRYFNTKCKVKIDYPFYYD